MRYGPYQELRPYIVSCFDDKLEFLRCKTYPICPVIFVYVCYPLPTLMVFPLFRPIFHSYTDSPHD